MPESKRVRVELKNIISKTGGFFEKIVPILRVLKFNTCRHFLLTYLYLPIYFGNHLVTCMSESKRVRCGELKNIISNTGGVVK